MSVVVAPAAVPVRRRPALDAVQRRLLRAWALALMFGAGAYWLAGTSFRILPQPRPLEELSYYPSGRHLIPATLGHAETAADLAWLRAVQYYGEHRHTDNRFDRMDHVFDILTTLAPHFLPAYSFGGFALEQEGGRFDRAERLMLKGIEANPGSGELAFQLGFLYYVKPGGRDLKHAAQYFEQAARQPDAPPEAARFAAFAHQNAGELAVAYLMWADVEKRSPNRYLREMAEREMKNLTRAMEERRIDIAVRHLTTPVVRIDHGP